MSASYASGMHSTRHKESQEWHLLVSGTVAATISRSATAPLERLKLEYIIRGTTAGIAGLAFNILRKEGLVGFWKTNGANILRTAPFKAINFTAFDLARRRFLSSHDPTLGPHMTNMERFAAGAAAGVTATVICFPMDVVRTRLAAPGGEAYGGIARCLAAIVRQEGLGVLYRGLSPALLATMPQGAVFYGVYDILRTRHLQHMSELERKQLADLESSEVGELQCRQGGGAEREQSCEVKGEGEHYRAQSQHSVKPAARESSGARAFAVDSQLDPFRTLLFGAAAGAASEVSTYPLEVVRRRLQTAGVGQFAGQIRLGIVGTMKQLVEEAGVRALYRGLLPSLAQVLPSAALSFYAYETCKTMLRDSA